MQASASDARAAAALALLLLAARPALAADVGVGAAARPALGRVGVAEPGRAGAVAGAVSLSGGVTEPLNDDDSAHVRGATTLAAAVNAARMLDFAARFDARYDRHARDERGVDDGFAFQPELSTRLSFRSGAAGFGIEAAAWLPSGTDVGASAAAVSADGRLLISGQSGALVVAGFGGYRLDRSAEAAGDADRLRFGDRSALGASDYDQALCGLGVGYSLGSTLLFGEASAQLLLGGPKLTQSPLWLSIGMRRALGATGLSAEVSLSALLSSRPELGSGAPLVPIEPRGLLSFGLRYGSTAAKPPPPPPPPPPTPAAPAAPVAAAPEPPSVELALLDDRGQPLRNASATIVQGEQETPLVETEPGRYQLKGAPSGRAKLRIKAEGFQPVERDIELGAGKPLRLDVKAEQALPAGQVRGLVRAFKCKGLAASVRIEPAGIEAKTDAEGFFQIDVPPGEYEVVIDAPGYSTQRRKAKVEQQGVVIVNADLSKAP